MREGLRFWQDMEAFTWSEDGARFCFHASPPLAWPANLWLPSPRRPGLRMRATWSSSPSLTG
eukprot:1862271-Alexandrium_andersonii.AAC.1